MPAETHVAEDKDKPVYDEQTLARLLEAAYVLQEHNRELRQREVHLELQRDQLGAQERAASLRLSSASHPQSEAAVQSPDDYTPTLAQIVETQRQIQARNLHLQAAMDLVVERITEIAKAGGAGIGTVTGKQVRYRAAAGDMALAVGTDVAMEKSLCVASLRTGQVIRCTDVNAEFLLDVEECRRRGIASMIAVPIYRDAEIAGGLELYYAKAQAFSEQDVHTCQLMAGLVTEALAKEDENASEKSMADQRAAIREALEKIRPTVAALVDRAAAASATSPQQAYMCRKCGHPLVGEEQFCGNCGTPRSGDYGTPTLQSKVASFWQMQEAMKKNVASSSGPSAEKETEAIETGAHAETRTAKVSTLHDVDSADKIESLPTAPPTGEPAAVQVPVAIATEATEAFSDPVNESVESSGEAIEAHAENDDEETALVTHAQPWTSAAAARHYLEGLAGTTGAGAVQRFWKARRGDVYLTVSLIVVAIVVCWGVWSNHAVSATGSPPASHHRPDPNADLSWFDRMLIGLGLAEAPAPPESKGNPETQVWVDLHTALYYCPGTDLYGKTPKGKYTSQRDAQLDQFGPASGRPCD